MNDLSRVASEARDGNLIKIRNGVYGTIDSLTGGMIDIEKTSFLEAFILPLFRMAHLSHDYSDSGCVLCCHQSKRRVKVPDMLDVKLVYQSDSILGIGVIQGKK